MPRGICAPSRVNSSGPLQEIDDLVQLVLRLVHAGDIGEGDLHVGLRDQLGLRAADRQQAAAETATPPPRPPIIAREANIQMPTNSSGGRIQDSSVPNAPLSVAVPLNSTLCLRKLAWRGQAAPARW